MFEDSRDNIPTYPPPARRTKPIEWVILAFVVAILIGLIIPGHGIVIENAKKVSAKSTLVSLVNAVKNYRAEYGIYPTVSDGFDESDITFDFDAATGPGKGGHNANLLDVIRAVNVEKAPSLDRNPNGFNPRHIVYFEYRDVKTIRTPHDGIIPRDAGPSTGANGIPLKPGDLVDAWGNLYCIRIDAGETARVCDPYSSSNLNDTSATKPEELVHTPVIAWSLGKTGKLFHGGKDTDSGAFEQSGNIASWR